MGPITGCLKLAERHEVISRDGTERDYHADMAKAYLDLAQNVRAMLNVRQQLRNDEIQRRAAAAKPARPQAAAPGSVPAGPLSPQ